MQAALDPLSLGFDKVTGAAKRRNAGFARNLKAILESSAART